MNRTEHQKILSLHFWSKFLFVSKCLKFGKSVSNKSTNILFLISFPDYLLKFSKNSFKNFLSISNLGLTTPIFGKHDRSGFSFDVQNSSNGFSPEVSDSKK